MRSKSRFKGADAFQLVDRDDGRVDRVTGRNAWILVGELLGVVHHRTRDRQHLGEPERENGAIAGIPRSSGGGALQNLIVVNYMF